MKRPEKMKRVEYDESEVGRGSENRVYNYGFDLGFKVGEVDGHNSACDAWEKFLLSKKEIFGCKLGMNHCVSGTSDCKNQSVVNGCCKYYLPKKS